MSMSDPIADMLTRIRNAARISRSQVNIRASKICEGIASVLKKEGYIEDFDRIDDGKQGILRITLKYDPEGRSIINEISRTSKPGCRIYSPVDKLPRVLAGLGIAIVSTSKGVISVELKGMSVKVSGPLGQLQMEHHPRIKVIVDGEKVLVENDRPQDRQNKQLHGTMRALIANMIAGVDKGFERKMEIYGTGYNIKDQGGKLVLQVGFSHPIQLTVPKNVKVNIDVAATRGNDVPAKFTLSSIDKCLLGQFAADIRKIRPPEPYKGKGIRYADEHVQRKVGKAFASSGAA